MPRAKGGFKTRHRRKGILDAAKGYYGGRSRLFRVATEARDTALGHAYHDRKLKKREFRALWIIRINAAVRASGLTYGQFIHGLKRASIALDRKALADMAYNDPSSFRSLAETARATLAVPGEGNLAV